MLFGDKIRNEMTEPTIILHFGEKNIDTIVSFVTPMKKKA